MTLFSSHSSATFVSPTRTAPETAVRQCTTPRGPHGSWYHAFTSVDNNSHCRRLLRQRSNDEQVIASVDDDEQDKKLLLVERYQDGSAKRYVVDNSSQLQTYWEKHGFSMHKVNDQENISAVSRFGQILKYFILPAGFPESVSDDYLDYMILQFPTNVTGWICHTLVTSSLLKAVGLDSSSGTSSAAYAASIRWVLKDGLGAVGRLFIGGRFGNLFDDDPKQWRMYADLIGSAGSIFELSTQLYPTYFLPLASLGNLTKAIARGLKDPSFRVIQNHFSVSANLGEVAAKEEVWEVVAQLFGLGIGILLLDIPGIQRSYNFLFLTWLGIRLMHLWLRYQSLSVLKFDTINLKRARLLVKSHIFCHTVPGPVACNKEEDILLWERFSSPRVVFNVPMQTMVGRDISSTMVNKLLVLYAKQSYILFVKQHNSKGLTFSVTFKVGATSMSVLKSLWQAYWLYKHNERGSDTLAWLEESLLKLEDGFTNFLHQLKGAGWDDKQITLKVPKELLFDESNTS